MRKTRCIAICFSKTTSSEIQALLDRYLDTDISLCQNTYLPHITLGYFYASDANILAGQEFINNYQSSLFEIICTRLRIFSNHSLVLLPDEDGYASIKALSQHLKSQLPFKLFHLPHYPHLTISRPYTHKLEGEIILSEPLSLLVQNLQIL